jgi:RNA polymerase sigma factor (sigma-70 family)
VTNLPQIADQDDEAARQLLAHQRLLRGFFVRRMRRTEDADDLVQELYARVLAAAPEKKILNWRAFLLRSASNLLIEQFRRAQSRNGRTVALEEASHVESDTADNPEQLVAAREELARMEQALLRLDPVRRQAFLLVRVHGNSHREVADALGIELTAVGRHIEAAMLQLTRARSDLP